MYSQTVIVLASVSHRLVLLLAVQRLQEEVISITGLSLAFCGVALFAKARRSLCKAPFKRPDKAGSMLIPDGVGNFFHAHVAVR